MADVDAIHNSETTGFKERLKEIQPKLELIKEESRFAVVKDSFGELRVRKDSLLKGSIPNINSACNKTEYFKNQLTEKHPHSLDDLEIISEFKSYKSKLLCRDKFGLVEISPNSLMDGKLPNQRSAVNYKEYLKAKLKYIHSEFNYDFEVIDSEYSYLICKEHGRFKIQNKYLLMGYRCPICKSELGSNVLYLIHLTNNDEDFYKIGITRNSTKGLIRYKDYRALGYSVSPLLEIEFDNSGDSKYLEQRIKTIIKSDLYIPKHWTGNSSRETFSSNRLVEVRNEILNYLQSCDRVKAETNRRM